MQFFIFPEGTPDVPASENFTYCDFPRWFLDWKSRHLTNASAIGKNVKINRNGRPYDFRYDCVKFSHKVAALTEIGLSLTEGLLIWLDSDTIAHDNVDEEWLRSLNPTSSYLAWLDRERNYPECGFMIFRCDHSAHRQFMETLRHTYESDEVFKIKETHDSYVIQHLVMKGIKKGWMDTPYSLSGIHRNCHHPFIRSELGARLDHLKGRRKSLGRSPHVEVRKVRKEPYWKLRRR